MKTSLSPSPSINSMDWVIIKCLILFIVFVVTFFVVNELTFQYAFVNVFHSYQAVLFLSCVIAYSLAVASGIQSGYLILVVKGAGLMGIAIGLQIVMTGILITTPFPLQDEWFYRVDQAIGYEQKVTIQFIIDHPLLRVVLAHAYNSLKTMAMLVGIALLISMKLVSYYRYIAYFLITFLIGSLIYYFFPSTDVSSIIPSKIFSPSAYMVVEQFKLEHNYKPISQFAIGLISMPSFHTIWAMVITFSLWNVRYLRWIALCYSVIVVISALCLGAHFLVDILAGLVIASGTWRFVVWMIPKTYHASSLSQS
ncbi:MAG: hypothetical protein CL816_02930 [Coxiellaceae bacterium]|nr:hypothetical protein [Coxiellaceae bacterium]